MTLPNIFLNSKEYFEECLNFFEEYKYLYSVSNVEILIHNVLDEIKINIDDDVNIFDEHVNLTEINDGFLTDFFSKLKRLQVYYDDIDKKYFEDNFDVPLTPKKKHEILYLAKEIKELCENVGCELAVDFGSGLGYLDQHIFETSNLKVLGIECNENHYTGAKKRQRQYHENSIENVKYIKHTIDENSHEKVQTFVREKFRNDQQFCITGLHACADLTVDAIDIFLHVNNAKGIAIMPCCYHKMILENGNFKNFPKSQCLKEVFGNSNGEKNLRVPFLRLAAQPPNVDEKLNNLVFNLLSRAVLQLYAHKNNCKLKRKRRKPVKTKTTENNFETYVQDAIRIGFTLIENEPLHDVNKTEHPTFDVEELKTLWNEISTKTLNKAGIYILLQNLMQPVVENFILYDRLVYLKEKGVENCTFKKILDEKTSPRCLALVAHK